MCLFLCACLYFCSFDPNERTNLAGCLHAKIEHFTCMFALHYDSFHLCVPAACLQACLPTCQIICLSDWSLCLADCLHFFWPVFRLVQAVRTNELSARPNTQRLWVKSSALGSPRWLQGVHLESVAGWYGVSILSLGRRRSPRERRVGDRPVLFPIESY